MFDKNGVDAEGLDYSRLSPLLIEAVKSLMKENTALEKSIASLIEENNQLNARISRLEQLFEELARKE